MGASYYYDSLRRSSEMIFVVVVSPVFNVFPVSFLEKAEYNWLCEKTG